MDESKGESQVPKSSQPEIPTMRRSRLSTQNLRIHTAAYPKQPYFPIERIQEAHPQPDDELNGDQQTPADNLGFSYDGLSPQDIDMKARKKASMDTLKLYSGNLASLSTPMERLIARQDGKSTSKVVEALEPCTPAEEDEPGARELACELSKDGEDDDVVSVGSLQASSDTLSVTREKFVELTKDKKEQQGARNWRRLRMRRRNTLDKTRAMKRTTHRPTAPAPIPRS